MKKHRFFGLLLCIGLLVACAAPGGVPTRDLPARLAAANLLAGSLAAGLTQATAAGRVVPESGTAVAILVTLSAVELALDGAGDAWRAGLPALAESNLDAAERQMSGLQPLLPISAGGE
ncbi:hypothetical protein [Dongia sp.]|uniref:hypothetical protein n=1 Tax=Dongia sp. TaxID=1977262 RepID=UPI0035B4CFFD